MNQSDVQNLHPCFGKAKNRGRIHLPVSPACNIFCRFCNRKINQHEDRPGVTSALMKPEEAVGYITKALKLCPEITVAGIAGPGDTLATDHALDTFRLIKQAFPELIKCMSTNGLLLYERIDELIEVGINTLTVTVNAVEPGILSKLCGGIVYHGQLYPGQAGARLLIENQLKGIEAAAKAGLIIKVNTVLVSEINQGHIRETAEKVGQAGAHIFNIIPLIPQHELSKCQVPTCEELALVREQAEAFIPVFRHCQHCRADAAGIPGKKDFGAQLYTQRVKDTFSHG